MKILDLNKQLDLLLIEGTEAGKDLFQLGNVWLDVAGDFADGFSEIGGEGAELSPCVHQLLGLKEYFIDNSLNK